MGFSRQGYWSGLPCPSPGHLPNPGIEPTFLMSPASAGGFFITSTTWEAICRVHNVKYHLSIKLLEKLKWRNLSQVSEAVEQVLTLLQTCPDTDWIPCQFRSSASHEEFQIRKGVHLRMGPGGLANCLGIMKSCDSQDKTNSIVKSKSLK